MFAKSKVLAVSALLVALAVVSMGDSASQAFARGGRGGGGGRGGRAQSISRARGSGPMRSSKGRSNRKTYAHNQQHNKQHNKNNKHYHRDHGRYGWGAGTDGDGADVDSAVDPYAVDAVAVPAPITILNPAETGRTVSYTLGSTAYSIEPSRSLAHNNGTQVIAFDRGASLGQATYTLQPGTYRFVMTNAGWDLRAATDQLAANSAAYPE
jgi:hypothetical protein